MNAPGTSDFPRFVLFVFSAMDILTSVPSYPDDTRTTSAPQYVANSAESIKTTAPTPTQQDASFPGPRTVPAPQYALAQQHPNYGYDQSGVDGPRDQLEMVIMLPLSCTDIFALSILPLVHPSFLSPFCKWYSSKLYFEQSVQRYKNT